MTIQLEIPDEFESHYKKDKFDGYFRRVCSDIDIRWTCGVLAYKTIKMMHDAFEHSKPIC